MADSPSLSCDFKHEEVTTMENRDDDQKHQEQEADEKHNSLHGHSCQSHTDHRVFNPELKPPLFF